MSEPVLWQNEEESPNTFALNYNAVQDLRNVIINGRPSKSILNKIRTGALTENARKSLEISTRQARSWPTYLFQQLWPWRLP